MPVYKTNSEAMVWGELVGRQQGTIPAGTQGDSIDERVAGDGYTYCYFQNIGGKKGWVWKQRLTLVLVPPPEPPPASEEYILHVKDGVQRKFLPE